jgi:hypothetical protein
MPKRFSNKTRRKTNKTRRKTNKRRKTGGRKSIVTRKKTANRRRIKLNGGGGVNDFNTGNNVLNNEINDPNRNTFQENVNKSFMEKEFYRLPDMMYCRKLPEEECRKQVAANGMPYCTFRRGLCRGTREAIKNNLREGSIFGAKIASTPLIAIGATAKAVATAAPYFMI